MNGNTRIRRLAVLAALLAAACASAPRRLAYPPAPARPVTETIHGTAVADPYRWLEDGADPEVAAWQVAQNELARAYLDGLPERTLLAARLDELLRLDDPGDPFPVLLGERHFGYQQARGDEHGVYFTQAAEGAERVVLLDPNSWPEGETLAFARASRDGRLVAYGRDREGREDPEVRILEVETGRDWPEPLRGWRKSFDDWLPDGSGFFYSACPRAGEVPAGEEHYWHTVYRHRLGRPAEEDERVFGSESEKEDFHGVSVSEDGGTLVLYRARFDKSEVYFKPLGSREPPRPLATGFDASYSVEVLDRRLLIETDRDTPRSRIFVADLEHPEREAWREIVAEQSDPLRGVAAVGGRLYAIYSHDVASRILIYDLDGRRLGELPLPGSGTAGVYGHWSRPEVGVYFTAYDYPPEHYRYDAETGELRLVHRLDVHFDASTLAVEQLWFASPDGTRVPMYVVTGPNYRRDGGAAGLLTGYGGFQASLSPHFDSSSLPWIEAGGLVAVVNARGGSEFGSDWHESATRTGKQRTFDDFLAAAEFLISEGYVEPERLAASGASNGGLLVGAALTQRPDLFRAVACGVPLLDMVRYERFGLAGIWAQEYGSAADPEEFQALYAYSPYHRVEDGARYPAVLLTASENDARVDPAHARKMAARLQAASASEAPVLLLVRGRAGHGGGTRLGHYIANVADELAFLMRAVGLAPAGDRPR